MLRPNGVVTSYASGGPVDRSALPFYSLLLNGVTLRLVLVFVMPIDAKQKATQDIITALEAGALRHNIAQRYPLTDVAALMKHKIVGR